MFRTVRAEKKKRTLFAFKRMEAYPCVPPREGKKKKNKKKPIVRADLRRESKKRENLGTEEGRELSIHDPSSREEKKIKTPYYMASTCAKASERSQGRYSSAERKKRGRK